MDAGSGQVVFLVAVSAQLRPRERVKQVDDLQFHKAFGMLILVEALRNHRRRCKTHPSTVWILSNELGDGSVPRKEASGKDGAGGGEGRKGG